MKTQPQDVFLCSVCLTPADCVVFTVLLGPSWEARLAGLCKSVFYKLLSPPLSVSSSQWISEAAGNLHRPGMTVDGKPSLSGGWCISVCQMRELRFRESWDSPSGAG